MAGLVKGVNYSIKLKCLDVLQRCCFINDCFGGIMSYQFQKWCGGFEADRVADRSQVQEGLIEALTSGRRRLLCTYIKVAEELLVLKCVNCTLRNQPFLRMQQLIADDIYLLALK